MITNLNVIALMVGVEILVQNTNVNIFINVDCMVFIFYIGNCIYAGNAIGCECHKGWKGVNCTDIDCENVNICKNNGN